MRKLLWLLLVITTVEADCQNNLLFASNSPVELAEKTFTLEGSFIEYNADADSFHYASVIYNHAYKSAQVSHLFQVEKDGNFTVSFLLNHPQEIMLEFGEEVIDLYAVPGCSLRIILDMPAFRDKLRLPQIEQLKVPDPVRFPTYDPLARINYEINLFDARRHSAFDYLSHYAMIDSLDQMQYKQYRMGIMDQLLDSLNAFAKYQNSSRDFFRVMQESIRYNTVEDLARYYWLHPMMQANKLNKSSRTYTPLTTEYLSFQQEFPLNNSNGLITEYYTRYLREYINLNKLGKLIKWQYPDTLRFFEYLINNSRIVQDSDKGLINGLISDNGRDNKAMADTLMKKYGKENGDLKGIIFDKILLDSMLLSIQAGIGRDLIVARLMSERLEKDRIPFQSWELPQFLSLISSKTLKNSIARDNDSLIRVLAGKLPQGAHMISRLNASQDKVFEELLKPYKGKMVYIDFWAQWCGPCMSEMSYSLEMQKELIQSGVIFLYVAVSCTRESWENTNKERKIVGEHYITTNDEYKLLSGKFNITGIPRYLLVNKKGQVVTDMAPRPSEKEKLRSLIRKLSD